MFYEILGPLLRLAGDAVRTSDHPASHAAFARKELRRASLLMERVGTAWPALFGGLAAENRILASAVEEAASALARHGLDAPIPVAAAIPEDPLQLRRRLLEALDDAVIALHAADAEWGRATLGGIRRLLGEAAEIQLDVMEGRLRTPLPPT